jgi:hypothetical protein
VDADITAFLFAGRIGRSQATFACSCVAVGGRLRGLDLLVGVVDEILFVRHVDLDGGNEGARGVEVGGERIVSEATQQAQSRLAGREGLEKSLRRRQELVAYFVNGNQITT